MSALRRARREDDELEEQLATDGVDVEHARIAEELAEVASDRGRGRFIRRTEIDQEKAMWHAVQNPVWTTWRSKSSHRLTTSPPF